MAIIYEEIEYQTQHEYGTTSQFDGLTERVNETMQILLRCYTTESGFDWVSHLLMIEFYYNCATNESYKHSPFKASYGFQQATPVDRLLPLTGAPAPVANRLTELASVRDVVRGSFFSTSTRFSCW